MLVFIFLVIPMGLLVLNFFGIVKLGEAGYNACTVCVFIGLVLAYMIH